MVWQRLHADCCHLVSDFWPILPALLYQMAVFAFPWDFRSRIGHLWCRAELNRLYLGTRYCWLGLSWHLYWRNAGLPSSRPLEKASDIHLAFWFGLWHLVSPWSDCWGNFH